MPPPLNGAFTRISKPLPGISRTSRPLAQETMQKLEKSLKESTVVCNQAAAFNRCVSKVQNDIQDNLKLLFGELGKAKPSHKADRALNELKDFTAFQQKVNFVLGKSIQHTADTLFVQAVSLTLLCCDSYLKYLKPGVKPDTC